MVVGPDRRGMPNDDEVFIWHSNGPVSNRSRRFNAGALRRNADAVVIAGDHRARSAVHEIGALITTSQRRSSSQLSTQEGLLILPARGG